MSKANNLKDFLTDVADAIRAKKGSTGLINPQDFSSEIASLSGSGGLEIVEMTETTATIEPNKVYVWGMVESLDITLGASTNESDFFAFRFRCSKPTMTIVTVNGATWAEDTELDAEGKPVLDLGSWYQCEIKGGTSALYARLAHYIPFEDSNVESVLLAKGVGDGLGITYKDAAKVTDISTWFNRNTDITAFSEFVNFLGIRTIVDGAFNGCTSLAEIALPTSLTSIRNGAFNSCTSLAEITFPASLTSIGNYTFLSCKSLTRAVNFENTQLTSISSELFKNCTSLTEITLPAGVTSIGGYAFNGCTSLAEITLPAGVTSIGQAAFNNCKLLARVLNLENTKVTSIGDGAFNGCTSLTEIAFPASLTGIGGYAFSGCKSLTRAVNFENTQLTSISSELFKNCTSLTEITLPAGVTVIRAYAFQNCTLLTEIAFPASLTGIGNTAFKGCSSLTRVMNLENTKVPAIWDYTFQNCTSLAEITFPASLTSIEGYAFSGCSSLQYIRIEATTPPTLSAINAIPSTIGAIYVPDESVEAYKAATNWSSFASKIKGISEMPAE